MFSNNHLIELTFNYFYIFYSSSLFIEIQLNQYKFFLFFQIFINKVLLFGVYKTSVKILIQAFFCWFLTCVYHIYWISVNWSWKLSLGFIENGQWAIYKLDMWICSPRRFVEGCGSGDGFCDCACCNWYINWIQGSSRSLKCFGGLLENYL